MISMKQLRKEILEIMPPSFIKKWGAIHPYFVPIYGDIVYGKRLKICMRLIEKYASNPKSIIDIGCGFGLFVRLLKYRYPTSNIVGLDLRDYTHLTYARKISKNKCTFIQGDVEQLPIKSNKFDVIIITDVLEHVSNTTRSLKELRRILTKNGLLLILVPTESILLKLGRSISYHKLDSDYHWTHDIKNIKQFENELKHHFKIIKKVQVPFKIGGPLLNYDTLFVCRGQLY
jgi:ubiquinone/menaquinone biosynthesis C-methylase UbiE